MKPKKYMNEAEKYINKAEKYRDEILNLTNTSNTCITKDPVIVEKISEDPVIVEKISEDHVIDEKISKDPVFDDIDSIDEKISKNLVVIGDKKSLKILQLTMIMIVLMKKSLKILDLMMIHGQNGQICLKSPEMILLIWRTIMKNEE